MKEGWEEFKLKEIGTIVSGGTPKTKVSSYWNGDVSWITPADLSGYDDIYIAEGRKSITEAGLKNSSAKMMPAGSVLFSSRAPIGYVAIASRPVATNQGFKSIVPKEMVLPEYLFYYLKSIRGLAESRASGTTFKEISKKVFADLPIPLPPLPEQRAIVAKLERLFAELDRSVAELETAREKLGVYRQSVLKEAFSGRLLGGEKAFSVVPLNKVAIEIRNGISAKPTGSEQDTKILRISSVRPFVVNTDDRRYINESGEEYSKYLLKVGDLLFTRYNGSRHYVGVAGVFKSQESFYYPDKLIRVRIDQSVVDPTFLMYAVNSGQSRLFIEKRIRTTAGQSGISGRDIKQVPIPLPSLTDQLAIVQEIEIRFSVADKLEQEITESLERARGLRQGVLKRAFAGELVTAKEVDTY